MRFAILAFFLITALPAQAASAAPAGSTAPDPVFGTWTNPKRTIAVRTAPCGSELCGVIVAATTEAQNDAREAGVARLVGTELLRDYRKTGTNSWPGTVFVPDLRRSFSSHIVQRSAGVLRISGCILGGLLCKSQDWIRL